ncbi:MAG: hypothetical protein AMXMBFR33_14070 [Candidatus Xenobia bacterium]|jgi:hypothetical protein
MAKRKKIRGDVRVAYRGRTFGSDPGLDNRRQSRRMARQFPIWYRPDGEVEFQRSRTLNFSSNGARIMLPAPLDPEGGLLLEFELEDKLRLQARARLIWQRPMADGSTLAGIHFELPPDVQNRLNNWVKKQAKAS